MGQREHSLAAGNTKLATLEDSLVVSSKTKVLLPYEPAVMILGIYPNELS